MPSQRAAIANRLRLSGPGEMEITCEVTRCATDGTQNACSKLYSAAWRAAQQLGFRRCVTYILDTEHGASLNAAGWRCIGKAGGGSWSRRSRPRVDEHPTQGKIRFEVHR